MKIKEKVWKEFPKAVVKKSFQEYTIHRGVSDLIIDLTLAEVIKIIDEVIIEEAGDSTHDLQLKANIHSQIKQKLGIEVLK